MSVDAPARPKCHAKARSTGNRCGNYAIPGGTVCRLHGGAAPQVRKAARLRLAELVDPSITVLARALADPDADYRDRIKAAEAVLDRTGHPRRTELDVTGARERLLERLRHRQESNA